MIINCDPEFSSGYVDTDECNFEIFEDGNVEISGAKGWEDLFYIKLDDLAEVVRQAKMFRDRRTAKMGED